MKKQIMRSAEDLPEAVVGRLLIKKGMRLSIAESCTGGLIANRLTNIPGSSKYFDSGIVAYSNESKLRELGVAKGLIRKSGAVSRAVAIAMAKGMLKKSGSDIAIAVTGIAGPSGGTKQKPVGLVYIALAQSPPRANQPRVWRKTYCIKCHFAGSRLDIKKQAATVGLDVLRKALY